MRSGLALVLTLGLLLGSPPAQADPAPEIDIEDVEGDANGVFRDKAVGPVSYAAADLVSVDLHTSHEAVPVGNGTDYRPTNLSVAFETSASPGEILAGQQLIYRFSTRKFIAAQDWFFASVFIEGVVSKSPTGAIATTARLRQGESQCEAYPDRCWSASKPEWTAQINASEKTLTLTFPFSSLDVRERRAIGVGGYFSSPQASTHISGTDSAVQDVTNPIIDDALFGIGYVVGAEVPEDVDCTAACESAFYTCFRSAGWANTADTVKFYAAGDEACEKSADVGGVKLTVTGERCPADGACTQTSVVKECPGRRCVASLSLPYESTETASYRTIARWEFGNGQVMTMTVTGLCHRTNPLEECPDSGQKEIAYY